MDSILTLEELMDKPLCKEEKLRRYRQCLREFELLGYQDLFIEQIRQEARQLEQKLARRAKGNHKQAPKRVP
ncbi:hypothetical protein [Shewanella sp. Isolate8]|uniref:hypothetical protein n=1 Tax=Shewanella sp. Isolate8 TaxID=2908529 RepID=UPI001EFC4AA3|nr:hypothetical protein [Shewanella sp. Isolate8]MCG9748596.1 hypothetical protein [Shewanella sp. Isolate8]